MPVALPGRVVPRPARSSSSAPRTPRTPHAARASRRGAALVEAIVACALAAALALPALTAATRAARAADVAVRSRRLERAVAGARARTLAVGCAAGALLPVDDASPDGRLRREGTRAPHARVAHIHVVPLRAAPFDREHHRPCD